MTAPKRPSSGGKKPAGNPKKPSPNPASKAATGNPASKAATGNPASKAATGNPASKAATGKPVPKPAPVAPKPAPKPVVEKIPPRGQLVPKLAKALKAHYKPFTPNTSRPLLDQVLIACCLENAPADVAEKAFSRLIEASFDLNEIRVTTVAELAEMLHDLPDPAHAALSLRRVLQGVFESTYNFSLEHAKKHSLAHGLKTLEHIHGIPPFVVQYITTTALGGHAIPLDKGALGALYVCGMITRQEYDSGKVAGLERLIGKKAGIEFSTQLHQFGIDVLTNLHGATVKKIVQAVNPSALKDRMPKRGEPLPAPVPPPPPAGKEGLRAAEAARLAAEEHRPAGPQAAARPAGKTPMPPAGSGPKKTADGKPGPKPFVVKPNVGKPLTIKPHMAPAPESEKPAAKKPPESAKPSKPATDKRPETKGDHHSSQLSKRKPR
jgi:hypothetical protein